MLIRRSRSAGAATLEDRLDLGDVVVVGGLRYDWYDSRASAAVALPGHLDHAGVRSGQSHGAVR